MSGPSRASIAVVALLGLGRTAAASVTPYSVSALNAYAGFPASDEPVLLAAAVTNGGSPATTGSVLFAVTQGTTTVGTPVSGAVSNGMASAVFIVPQGTANGSYAIVANYDIVSSVLAATDGTHVLNIAQAPTLVRTEALAPGSSGCAAGGVEVDSGLDDGADGGIALDGVLEAGEVQTTSDVCNGSSPAQTLIEAAQLPVNNSQCPNGGVQIDVGTDNGADGGTAGSGVLQPAEITSTVDICNGTNGANGTNGTDGANGKSGCASVPPGALALAGFLSRRRRR